VRAEGEQGTGRKKRGGGDGRGERSLILSIAEDLRIRGISQSKKSNDIRRLPKKVFGFKMPGGGYGPQPNPSRPKGGP